MKRALLAAVALGVSWLASDALAIVKCVDKAGKVAYQDSKCPDEAKQADVYIQAQPLQSGTPIVPGTGRPAPSTDAQLDAAEKTIAGYESCALAYPEFAQRHAETYNAWKRTNDRLYQRTRRNEGSLDRIKAEIDEAKEQQKTFTPEQVKSRLGYCDAAIPALLSRNIDEFVPAPKK